MPIQGSIEEAGLADVLQLLSGGKKTGCLSVEEGTVRGEIFLVDGHVAFATVSNRADRLGEILVNSGRITQRQLDEAARAQSQMPSRPIGAILVDAGLIERVELERFVAIQAQESVYALFTWTRGTFVFTSAIDRPATTLQTPLDPQSLLLEGARRVDEWSQIQRKVPSFDLVYKRRVDAPTGAVADDLTDDQRRIFPLFDGVRDVNSVAQAIGLGEFEAGKALYGLIMVGLVQVVERRARMRHLDYRELLAYVVREAEYADANRRKEAGRHIADCPACSERLRSIHVRRTTGAVPAPNVAELLVAPDPSAGGTPPRASRVMPPLTPERAVTLETQVVRRKPGAAPRRVAPPMTPGRAVTVETPAASRKAPPAAPPAETPAPRSAQTAKTGTRPVARVAPPVKAAAPSPAESAPTTAPPAPPPKTRPIQRVTAPAPPSTPAAETPVAPAIEKPAAAAIRVVPAALPPVAPATEAAKAASPAPPPKSRPVREKPERRARDRRRGLDRRTAERRDEEERRNADRRTGQERRGAADSGWLRSNSERRAGQRRAAFRRGTHAPDRRGLGGERRAVAAGAPAASTGSELLMRRETRADAKPAPAPAPDDLPWIMTPRESIELLRASRPVVRPKEATETPAPVAARPRLSTPVPVVVATASTPVRGAALRRLGVAAGIVGVAGLGYALGQIRGSNDARESSIAPLAAVTTSAAAEVPKSPVTDSTTPARVAAPQTPAQTSSVPVRSTASTSTRNVAARPPAAVAESARVSVPKPVVETPVQRDVQAAAPPPVQTPPPSAATPPPPTQAQSQTRAAEVQVPPSPPQTVAPAPTQRETAVTHTAKEPDRELGAGGWTTISPADAGAALGSTLGAIEGLSIESIAQSTSGTRVRVRVAQIAESGDRIILTETRAGAAVRPDGPVRVTALRVMPPSEAYPYSTGSASLGNVLITAKSTVAADALRQLLEKLAAVQ